MTFVTYEYFRLKCYINLFTLFYIVPKRMGSNHVLARAIDNFKLFFKDLKKNTKKNYKINFSTVTLPSESIVHFKLSLASRFKCFFISLGIPVLNVLYWRLE